MLKNPENVFSLDFIMFSAFEKQLARPDPPQRDSNDSHTRESPEDLQSMLDKLTDLKLNLICSSTENEAQTEIEQNLLLTFQDRKNEFTRIHKLFCEAVQKQESSELGKSVENLGQLPILTAFLVFRGGMQESSRHGRGSTRKVGSNPEEV